MRDWIILTVVLTVVSGIAVSCAPPAYTVNTRPPGGSTNITNVSNGWYTFEWRGDCFLLKTGGKGSAMVGHVTTISCGEEDED